MLELISLPAAMRVAEYYGLIVLSFFTSLLTAAIGIGGGTIMLAILAQVLPVKAIIPVHGAVQLGSNLGRALVLLPNVRWTYMLWFVIGSIVGALIGGNLVISLPVDALRGLLACFILYSVWGPKFSSSFKSAKAMAIGGLLSTTLTMFVGATGPFILAMLKGLNLPREPLVATNAAFLVIQHLLKILAFGVLGFAFSPYLSLIILMIASGFIGTVVGKKILLKIDEQKFQLGLNIVLTLLAIRLLITAFD